MSGIVSQVYPIEGEALTPGEPLFEVRMTHEELVTAQREFLRSAEELDVVKREVARLESVGDGIVAGKTVLERKFEQQKIEAALHAQQQGLLLHGLSAEQVQKIVATRMLLQQLTVSAPEHEHLSDSCDKEHFFHMQSLNVKPGQHVEAGQNLCTIADHCELFIEGTAFEQDLERVNRAASEDWDVTMVLGDEPRRVVSGLKIFYLYEQIE
jgi:multidrug resistance efflux pump